MANPATTSSFLILGLGLLAPLTAPLPSHAQMGDGWDTTKINDASIAYAEYSTGQTIAIQCKGTDLQVIISGLPVVPVNETPDTTGSTFTVVDSNTRHTLAYLEIDSTEHPTTGIAIMPARLARALRSGHPVTLQAEGQNDIALAIPTDGSAVETLMSDCAIPISDDNDRRQIHGLSSMDILTRAQLRNLQRYPRGTYTITAQCVVAQNWKLQDCQTARQLPSRPRHDRIFSEALNGSAVKPEDGATAPLTVGDLVIFNYISTTTTHNARTR